MDGIYGVVCYFFSKEHTRSNLVYCTLIDRFTALAINFVYMCMLSPFLILGLFFVHLMKVGRLKCHMTQS